MPDLADGACPHMVFELAGNNPLQQLEWRCMDCGRAKAVFAFGNIDAEGSAIWGWAARSGVPDRAVQRYLREAATGRMLA